MVNFSERLREICAAAAKANSETAGVKAASEVVLLTAADMHHRRRTAGIPADHEAHLDAPRETKALAFAREWVASDKTFAIMSGESGVGKSFACCWVVDQKGGRVANAFDLCRAGMYGDDHWDDLRLAPFLALDELGPEPKDEKGYWEAKLLRLLAGRLDDKRRTLISTNLSKPDLRARYGSDAMARLWDRLEANWMGRVFTGPSLRKATP